MSGPPTARRLRDGQAAGGDKERGAGVQGELVHRDRKLDELWV